MKTIAPITILLLAIAASSSGEICSEEMFDDLRNLVNVNQEENEKDFKLLKDKDKSLDARLNDAEAQIELLKKMGAPKGDDGGAGLLDALNEITDKLRKEFMDRLDEMWNDLTKRIDALEQATKEVDDRQ